MQAISFSPSFSSYSNSKFAEVAARIVDEYDSDEFHFKSREISAAQRGEDDEEFEFVVVAKDCELSPETPADEIFRNGKIRLDYPVFNRDLLLQNVEFQNKNEKGNGVRDLVSPKIRLPLRKLFHEERETTITTSSSSSSEADDLDRVTTDIYCVWPPKAVQDGRCKKSNSAGCDSKRWKLRDFLQRSHSDGSKRDFDILSSSNSGREKEIEKKVTGTPADGGKVEPAAPPPRNRNDGEKQRSNLPFRQDLMGLFGNANGLGKYFQPY